MSNTNHNWKVLVSLNTTVSAWIPVEAMSKSEAPGKALDPSIIIQNADLFALDEDNFSGQAKSAYLSDPVEGVALLDAQETSVTSNGLSSKAKEVIAAASKGYDAFGSGIDLLDTTNPEVSQDGLAMFLAKELKDVMKGASEDQCVDEAICAVQRSISELTDVLRHIEKLQQ